MFCDNGITSNIIARSMKSDIFQLIIRLLNPASIIVRMIATEMVITLR